MPDAKQKGFSIVPNGLIDSLMENEKLGSSEILTLFGLLRFANNQGGCFPSIERLAATTKLSRRTVQRTVKKLVEEGVITVDSKAGKTYQFYIPARAELFGMGRHGDTPQGSGGRNGDAGGRHGDTPGCHGGTGGGDMSTPEHYHINNINKSNSKNEDSFFSFDSEEAFNAYIASLTEEEQQ